MPSPPFDLNQHMQQAVMQHQRGQLAQAEAMYRQALERFPRHADILNLLGTVCSQNARYDEGIKYLKKALQLQPGHVPVLINLGETLQRAGQSEAAIRSFRQALLKAPDLPVAHANLANILKQLGQLEAALAHYEQAIQGEPEQASHHYNYANTLREAGKLRSALAAYEQALRLAPEHAEAHNNLGTVLLEWDRFDEALYHYRQAQRLKPDFEAAQRNLLQYHSADGQLEAAREVMQQMRRAAPDNVHLELAEACLFPVIPMHAQEIDRALQGLSQTLNQLQGRTFKLAQIQQENLSPPSVMTYYGREDLALRKAYAQLFTEQFQPEALNFHNARPQLGFVVTHGHEGVFLKCMTGLLQSLPAGIDVTLVCSRPNGRAILSQHLPELNVLELPAELQQAVASVRAARFDLLYYWEVGTDAVNYFLPFFKPAKVQVASWGWPVSSGIPGLDVYLSASSLEPAGAQAHYSERLICLPRLPVYYFRPPVPAQGADLADFGLAPQQHLYLCAQNLRKVQPEMDALFQGILAADPQAVIGLIADKRPAISQALMTRLKISLPEQIHRIQMLPRLPESEYLALVKSAHVMLDTLHYSGGANTNYDAFAAGTPVVTWPGAFHRSRYTTAAYTQMGYTDWIAKDAHDYIHKAVKLAIDPTCRQAASQALADGLPELLQDAQARQDFWRSLLELT